MEPFDALTWPRHTERLTLRPATAADVDHVMSLFADPSVAYWVSREEEAARQRWEEGAPIPSTLVVTRDGEFIGTGMVRAGDGWGQDEVIEQTRGVEAELGWMLKPSAHGQGLGTELAAELLEISFTLGARRVFAQCFADNAPSWKVMEKLGMRREAHHVKESLHRELGWVDGYLYAILREEYPAGQ